MTYAITLIDLIGSGTAAAILPIAGVFILLGIFVLAAYGATGTHDE